MMEIRFRAWDKKRDCFVKNLYLIDRKFYLTWRDFDDSEEYDGDVEQFTGMKDKNGKEIYEGDIVKFENDDYLVSGPVEYCVDDAAFVVVQMKNNVGGRLYLNIINGIGEIIGNIHENPELLNDNSFKVHAFPESTVDKAGDKPILEK
jgi:uncharacterized phage protein (TIGR01671 family)